MRKSMDIDFERCTSETHHTKIQMVVVEIQTVEKQYISYL